jgi:uncharacterized protein (TIGR02145 family)
VNSKIFFYDTLTMRTDLKLNSQTRSVFLFIIPVLFLSLLMGCEKEDPVETATLTTVAASEITSVSASSGGNISFDGGAEVTIRGLLWNTSPNPTPENHLGITAEGSGSGMFLSQITNLSPNTSYYLRAYAVNSIGISYGNEIEFITEGVAATVETAPITEITAESALGGGIVSDNGGHQVTQRGVVWSTEENPTIENHLGKTTDGTGEGEFSSNLTDLNRLTTYYVRAYAINEKGTSYGNQAEFKTEPEIPVVKTTSVFQITSISAKAAGNVTDDGGLTVTKRGFVWSDFENPTIDNNLGFSEEGIGLGEFTSSLMDLVPETTYFIKAYAINDHGVAYGDEMQFVAENPQVIDVDGNVYETIILHNFLWLAENLKVTHYNDGSPVAKGLTDTEWSGTNSGAYAVYPHSNVDGINSDMEMLMTYGALYNWMAATDPKGLCPAEWRLPTDEEWKETEKAMGMSEYELNVHGWRGTNQGGQLKSTRTAPDTHPRWNQPNTLALDLFGYSSVPAGFREYYGPFSDIGVGTAWWTSTTNADISAWYRSNLWDRGRMGRFYGWNHYGFSVRCIQELH